MNECGPPSRAIEADFQIAMLELMAEHGYCGLAFSPGPGNPEIPAWDEWVRVLRWINDHPCKPGVYHGLAVHQSGKMPEWVETLPGSYLKDPWIYNRLEVVRLYLLANHDFSLRTFKGPIYITELGWSDYTIPNQSFTCEQVRAGLDETREMHRIGDMVTGFHIWNFRNPSGFYWTDLTGCLPVMYR